MKLSGEAAPLWLGFGSLIVISNFSPVIGVKTFKWKIVEVENLKLKTYIKRLVSLDRATDPREVRHLATYKDPARCFAPLEVLERLLEIRAEAGFCPTVYLQSPDDVADYLDAFGFDVYAFTDVETEFHFGDYRGPLAPGGDHAHCSSTTH
jgi:hypothetical protein